MPTKDPSPVASPDVAAAIERGDRVVHDGGKHPAVAGFVRPVSSTGAGVPADTIPIPSIIETATPGIARAVADLEADTTDGEGTVRDRNARERALAGHLAPDTVSLPEAKLRVEDNAIALGSTPSAVK